MATAMGGPVICHLTTKDWPSLFRGFDLTHFTSLNPTNAIMRVGFPSILVVYPHTMCLNRWLVSFQIMHTSTAGILGCIYQFQVRKYQRKLKTDVERLPVQRPRATSRLRLLMFAFLHLRLI